jgi:hypothetical protein
MAYSYSYAVPDADAVGDADQNQEAEEDEDAAEVAMTKMTRREFLKSVGIVAAGVTLLPFAGVPEGAEVFVADTTDSYDLLVEGIARQRPELLDVPAAEVPRKKPKKPKSRELFLDQEGWPMEGVTSAQVHFSHDLIDVTAAGQPWRNYAPGPMHWQYEVGGVVEDEVWLAELEGRVGKVFELDAVVPNWGKAYHGRAVLEWVSVDRNRYHAVFEGLEGATVTYG